MAWRPFRNLGLKMAALGLGALLWFTVTGERVERKIGRVPIVYSNIPKGLLITDQPDSVDVSVRGIYAAISQMQDITITVDLSGATAGSFSRVLRAGQVAVPAGIEVMQIDPGVVNLYLEQSDQRPVPIEADVVGEPASGFVQGEVTVDPAEVSIVGPRSRLTPATKAMTELVSIEGLSATVTRLVPVGIADAQLSLVEPLVATVTVVIEPARETRTFPSVPLRFSNRANLDIVGAPEAVAVTIQGRAAALASLDPAAVTAEVDVAGLGPGEYTLNIVASPPPGMAIERVLPATVTVRIR